MKVSVAIPVRNEERTVRRLLDSLVAQTLPPDEIVVADGGSTDATVEVLKGYGDVRVRVLEIGPAFPGRGRNEAVKAARNEWIAFIDAGCVADPGWLEGLSAARDRAGIDHGIVFGGYRPILDGPWAVAQALAFLSPLDRATGQQAPSIASTLVDRSAWARAGGFPEDLRAAEDLLFIDRLAAVGVPFTRAPEAVVRWSLASGPRAVFRRFRTDPAHHLAAGLWRRWHARVVAMDAAALVLLALGLRWWPFALACLLCAMVRVLRTASMRAANVGEGHPYRPGPLLRVAWLLTVADVAMWLGMLDYWAGREPRRG